MPALADEAHSILDEMDFGYYYNPAENQIRGGFWLTPRPGSVEGNYRGGDPVYYTGHHYGAFNTEPRMASYLGIASGQIPQKHYFGTLRTFHNDNCDWSWTEQRAVGEWTGPTSASGSSRARTSTPAGDSSRRGAARCSRR